MKKKSKKERRSYDGRILEEKYKRKNTKITKDKLKEIFEALYEKILFYRIYRRIQKMKGIHPNLVQRKNKKDF